MSDGRRRGEEVEDGGACASGLGWAVIAVEGGGGAEGIAVGFDEVAAFDVGLEVQSIDHKLDCEWFGSCGAWGEGEPERREAGVDGGG